MLSIKGPERSGFDKFFFNDKFKCAFITHSPQYAFGKVSQMKRHNMTDEIFVLLSGIAVMLIYENGIFTQTVLEIKRSYNVEKGTWHYLALSEDALVFVTENADTDSTNTDTIELETEYFIK